MSQKGETMGFARVSPFYFLSKTNLFRVIGAAKKEKYLFYFIPECFQVKTGDCSYQINFPQIFSNYPFVKMTPAGAPEADRLSFFVLFNI